MKRAGHARKDVTSSALSKMIWVEGCAYRTGVRQWLSRGAPQSPGDGEWLLHRSDTCHQCTVSRLCRRDTLCDCRRDSARSKGLSGRATSVRKLDKALDEAPNRGWIVVDMKADWNVVYP